MTGWCFSVLVLLRTCVVWAAWLNYIATAQQGFGQESSDDRLVHGNFMVDEFSFLNITSLGTNLIEDESDCGFACLEITSCFSYNLAVLRDVKGKLLCELLPSDKYNNSDKFGPSKIFHHFSIPSPCSSSPCKNNGKCVSLHDENGYKCVCKEGFIGQNCETSLSINSAALAHFLATVVGNDPKWLLCYRASINGWAASTFHSMCDGRNHTVTIIKNGPYVFGGYTDVPWESYIGYARTSNSFIFSLRDKEGLAPFKSNVTDPAHAIYRYPAYGPTFGHGHNIYIADNANSNTQSHTSIGNSYFVPSGVQDGLTILAGTHSFSPDEVEVFYLG